MAENDKKINIKDIGKKGSEHRHSRASPEGSKTSGSCN